MYKIEVIKAVNGIILIIGCRTYVNEDIDKGCQDLARFLKDPDVVEKEYAAHYPNWSSGTTVGTSEEVQQPVCNPTMERINR
jgi:hypothetical protein